MVTLRHDYEPLKGILSKLARELVDKIKATWIGDWSIQPPKVGSHFNYWDIKELPSYPAAIEELSKVPSFDKKYSVSSLDNPLGALLELTVGSLPDPSFIERSFAYWWDRFLAFLKADELPIKLFVGLSNFESTELEYHLNDEVKICFFKNSSLADELIHTVRIPVLDPFPSTGAPLHLIPAAIQIDFVRPANQQTLEYGHYSHDCIKRMLPLEDALRLSAFGRLVVGPWIPICNPSFPVDGVRAISSPEEHSPFYEPVFRLDNSAWERFRQVYSYLQRMYEEDRQDLEQGRAIRRRFNSTISRFMKTFDQGYWESVVVDLVIVMESILTPNKQGGGMPLALAGSNLLGTNLCEAHEIFENFTAMYRLRNQSVHGEPNTQETWEKGILQIANNAGLSATSLDDGVREYTFEIMRDYARRTIAGMLNLYYGVDRPPSRTLTNDFHRLHLDRNLATSVQTSAMIYPLSERPSFSPLS
jgi:hypothetical protein